MLNDFNVNVDDDFDITIEVENNADISKLINIANKKVQKVSDEIKKKLKKTKKTFKLKLKKIFYNEKNIVLNYNVELLIRV